MYKELFINSKNLPPKLTEEEFLNYYQKFKNGDMEARKKLSEHNLRLAIKKVNELMKKYSIAECYYEDVLSAAMYGLMKSVDTFNLENGAQFSTYAARVITNEIGMLLRKINKYAYDQSLDQLISLDDEGNDFTELDRYKDLNTEFEEQVVNKSYNAKIYAAMKKILNEQEFIVICYRYGFNGNVLTQEEVGKILGLCRSRISRIEIAALKKLREKLDENISEVEEYQKHFRKFNLCSIHEDLTPKTFKLLISFFPKHEVDFYTNYNGIIINKEGIYFKNMSGGGVSNDTEREQLELIEHDLREIFVYYTRLKANQYEHRVYEKTEKYCLKHFLRFRYKEYTLDKIRNCVKNLRSRFQNILYLRYGEDLLSYNELKDNKNSAILSLAHQKLKEELERKPVTIHPKSLRAIYSNLSFEELDAYVKKLAMQYQEIMYLRHSKSLDKYNQFPENKSYGVYYAMYQKAKEALEQVMSGQIVLIENKKSVINTYAKEDLLYALPKIPEVIQLSIYLRHGKTLNKKIPWTKIEILDDKLLNSYINNYNRSYKFIDRVLEERKELQEKSKKTSITKLEEYGFLEIQEAMNYLSEDERNVIYLKHGKNLTEFHPWPTNRPFSYYRDLYVQAIDHLRKILRDKNKPLEEIQLIDTADKTSNEIKPSFIIEEVPEKTKKKSRKGVRKNSRNILTEVSREDLLWAASKLNEHQLEILHLRHGENLDTVLEWPEIPEDKGENYYFYSYYNVCKKIHTLLENRAKTQLIESKEETNLDEIPNVSVELVREIIPKETKIEVKDAIPKKKKKKNKKVKQQVENQPISKKKAILLEQQKVLEAQKETNLKVEFYNRFYILYGEVISSEELKNIICEVVSSYTQDEGISIEYFCQFNIESTILVSLSNKYKANPDSEESLKILMQINSIFVKKMKAKYPFMEDSRIEMAIEEVFNNYEVEKNFSVELMKKLRQNKI